VRRKIVLFLCISLIIPIICCRDNSVSDYKYKIELLKKPEHWFAGEWNGVTIKVTNCGKIPWVVNSGNIRWRVRISYHLYDADGENLISEGIRTDFNNTVRPGETVKKTIGVYLPRTCGRYSLSIDLLKEGKFWFKDRGNSPLRLEIKAIDASSLTEDILLSEEQLHSSKLLLDTSSENRKIDLQIYTPYPRLNRTIRMIYRNYQKNYISESSIVSGYQAGSYYPQVWLRDNYYHYLSGSYLYPLSRLKKTLTAFLSYYERKRVIPDYIAPDGNIGRFTASIDRPAFLMLMACLYINQTGDYNWLKEKIGKRTVYNILFEIEQDVFCKYTDARTGLFASAHTADWGDVEFEESGEDALFSDRNSHKIAGIYNQSLYYLARRKWAKILYDVKLYQRSMETEHKAIDLRTETNRRLWNNKRKFYRIHEHLSELNHPFNEDNIFALGGNVWAIKAGIADDAKAEHILEKVNLIKKNNNLITISKVLHPPYPKGFFKHTLLAEPNFYQNGGFWDWYGAMAVEEEFKAGWYDRAVHHLLEIAGVALLNNNLFEWYDAEGRGQGSPHYLASGSSILHAVISGYFGIRVDKGKWKINPANDEKTRAVKLIKQDTGLKIIYRIKPIRKQRKIIVDYYLDGQDEFSWSIPVIKISPDSEKNISTLLQSGGNQYVLIKGYLYYTITTTQGKGRFVINY